MEGFTPPMSEEEKRALLKNSHFISFPRTEEDRATYEQWAAMVKEVDSEDVMLEAASSAPNPFKMDGPAAMQNSNINPEIWHPNPSRNYFISNSNPEIWHPNRSGNYFIPNSNPEIWHPNRSGNYFLSYSNPEIWHPNRSGNYFIPNPNPGFGSVNSVYPTPNFRTEIENLVHVTVDPTSFSNHTSGQNADMLFDPDFSTISEYMGVGTDDFQPLDNNSTAVDSTTPFPNLNKSSYDLTFFDDDTSFAWDPTTSSTFKPSDVMNGNLNPPAHFNFSTSNAAVVEDDAAVQNFCMGRPMTEKISKSGGRLPNRNEVQDEFETFARAIYPDRPMWHIDSIIHITKVYLGAIVHFSNDHVGEQSVAEMLYQHRIMIYRCAVEKISGFLGILLKWYGVTNNYIAALGVSRHVSKSYHKRFDTTDMELELIFQHVTRYEKSGLIQYYYPAWLLIWTCGVRPGALAVYPQNGEGESLGQDSERDETLRWSDIKFIRINKMHMVAIKFRYSKEYVPKQSAKFEFKEFAFLPCSGNRYHLDVSTIIIGLALKICLFPSVKTWEDFRNMADPSSIHRDKDINQKAVFMKTGNPLDLEELDRVLYHMAMEIHLWGLFGHHRNDYLRRTTILMKTLIPQDLADRFPEASSTYLYGSEENSESSSPSGNRNLQDYIQAAIRSVDVSRIDKVNQVRNEWNEYIWTRIRQDKKFIATEEKLQDDLALIGKTLNENVTTIQKARELLRKIPNQLSQSFEYTLQARSERLETLLRCGAKQFKKSASSSWFPKSSREAVSALIQENNQAFVDAHLTEFLDKLEQSSMKRDQIDTSALERWALEKADPRRAPKSWEIFLPEGLVIIEGDTVVVPGQPSGDPGRARFIRDFQFSLEEVQSLDT